MFLRSPPPVFFLYRRPKQSVGLLVLKSSALKAVCFRNLPLSEIPSQNRKKCHGECESSPSGPNLHSQTTLRPLSHLKTVKLDEPKTPTSRGLQLKLDSRYAEGTEPRTHSPEPTPLETDADRIQDGFLRKWILQKFYVCFFSLRCRVTGWTVGRGFLPAVYSLKVLPVCSEGHFASGVADILNAV